MAEKLLALQGVPLPDGAPIDLVLRAGETRRVTGTRARLDALAAVVSGLHEPEAGRVLLLGRAYSSMRAEDRRVLRAESIGVAAGAWPLLEWLTVRENVQLALPPNSEGPDDVLTAFGLDAVRDAFGTDSAAEGDAALLARGVVSKPRVLVWQPDAALPEKDLLSLLRRVRAYAGLRLGVLILLEDAAVPADGAPATFGSEEEPEGGRGSADELIEVPEDLRPRRSKDPQT